MPKGGFEGGCAECAFRVGSGCGGFGKATIFPVAAGLPWQEFGNASGLYATPGFTLPGVAKPASPSHQVTQVVHHLLAPQNVRRRY